MWLQSALASKEKNTYDLLTLQGLGEFKVVEEGQLYMLTKIENDLVVNFAFFTHGDNEDVELVMHGVGMSGSLRECRHTYWGDKGYIFYPSFSDIKKIFKELSVYFDDME